MPFSRGAQWRSDPCQGPSGGVFRAQNLHFSPTRFHEDPGGGWQFAETKRSRSRRTIKLQTHVLGALKKHKAAQEAARADANGRCTDNGLIFTTRTGGPLDERNVTQQDFIRVLNAAKLPTDFRLYDLRHTAATLALSAGVPPKVVSEMLGHASAAFTLDVYSHVLPHMQDSGLRRRTWHYGSFRMVFISSCQRGVKSQDLPKRP